MCFMGECCHDYYISGHALVVCVIALCFFAWLSSLSSGRKDGSK